MPVSRPTAGEVAVAGLAAYRLARLVVADTITERPRQVVRNWCMDGRGVRAQLAELVDCGHCAGVWCAAAAWLVLDGPPRRRRAGRFAVGAMAAAGVQSVLWSIAGRRR